MAIAAGAGFSGTPSKTKQTVPSAYLDFTGGANDWAQQYMPDLMAKEAEVFGNRTISVV